MSILDRAGTTRRIRVDASQFADELSRLVSDRDQVDLGKARDAAGSAVQDVAERARESLDWAAGRAREIRDDITRAGETIQADNPLDELGQRIRAVASTSGIRSIVARLERELPDTDKDRYDRAYARGWTRARSTFIVVGVAAGVTAGIVGAILLDPKHGKERRERIGQKAGSLATGLSSQAADKARLAGNRVRGMAVERGLVKPAAEPVPLEAVTGALAEAAPAEAALAELVPVMDPSVAALASAAAAGETPAASDPDEDAVTSPTTPA